MGDLNLSQYQSAVLRRCGNVPTTDPYVVAGDHTQAINDGANDLIRTYPNHFPEHKNRSWTLGPTLVDDNKIALPNNLRVLREVYHSEDNTVDGSDPDAWNSIAEKLMAPIKSTDIALIAKDSTVVEYPSLWDRKGTQLYYWPTTRTGKTTYLHLWGDSVETRISASGDTFRLNRDFDEAVVVSASAKFARIIGEFKRANELESELLRIMGQPTVVAHERAARPVTVRIAGMPGRGWR